MTKSNCFKYKKDIFFFSTSVFIMPNILVVGDLHLGYADIVNKQGSMLTLNQTNKIIDIFENILERIKKEKLTPKKLIILGDVKHDFGKLNLSEKRQLIKFFNYLSQNFNEIIITKGNHDVGLEYGLKLYKKIKLVDVYEQGDYVFYHGHKKIESDKHIHIIAHEHPRISITEKNKSEKFKCILAGNLDSKTKNKDIIILPSFNPLLEGSDIMFTEQFISPVLNREIVDELNVFVINNNEVLSFGKLKDVRDSMDVKLE